jgi:hypothetical protein
MIHPHIKYVGPAYPDGSDPTTMRELQTRVNDGIHVRLLWSEHDGRVCVAVTDTKTDEAFSVAVHDGERALDVFHHPYAYAASHGVDTQASSRPVDSDISLAA